MKKIGKEDPINILEQRNAVHKGIEAVKKIKSFFVLKELDQKEHKKVKKDGYHEKAKPILIAFFKEVCHTLEHRSMAHPV
jgi:hypothetical protein